MALSNIYMEDVYGEQAKAVAPLNTPENIRDVPCDSCPSYDNCMETSKECVAVRNWYVKGDYKDSDIGRLLRKSKY
jgi:hypothetical protein